MYERFGIDKRIVDYSEKALDSAKTVFESIDKQTEYNQLKVLSSFIDCGVTEAHFNGTTGYGYGDWGRETLDKLFAKCVGGEDSIIRHNFACGTHTLAVALYGILRPGDIMLCVTGTPYDTIHNVIGTYGEGMGSLKDFGIKYMQNDLTEDGTPDFDAIKETLLNNKIKMVYIQRSRGYSLRPTLSVAQIGEIVKVVRENSDAMVMVDNCYGEFTETIEPLDVDADIIAGSLIKNAGGGIAKTGGYIAGKAKYIELCSYRLTTPGLGRAVGATLNENRNMYLGVYNAPHAVGEALKTATFAAKLFEDLGFSVYPRYNESRHDIIQAIKLNNAENLIAFARGMQKGVPIDSTAVPEPSDMPGYDSKIISAEGSFTSGSTIELSADAPLREPFAIWMQGSLNFHSGKIGVMLAAQELLNQNLIEL